MGCGASTRVAPGTTHCLVVQDGVSRRYEHSIFPVESVRSFHSMTAQRASSHPSPPDAATHKRHVKRLQKFLAIIPAKESQLRREVTCRRLDLLRMQNEQGDSNGA
ncbi:unnamed protein product [Effrenium voratum]|nr:unnamed protein product [Effrenium voratum]